MDERLLRFKKFKKTFNYQIPDIVEKDNKLYLNDTLIKDENGFIGESDKWVNVGYNFHGTYPKLLSNLFPYTFTFKGETFNSIEGFFQGIKFPDINMQKEVFKYSGKEACLLKDASLYNWKETGYIYFLGEKIKRDSIEYDNLVDELYLSAIENPFYRNVLLKEERPIVHLMGEINKEDTVFTRKEFEVMLNTLHAFLIKENIDKN